MEINAVIVGAGPVHGQDHTEILLYTDQILAANLAGKRVRLTIEAETEPSEVPHDQGPMTEDH